MFTINKGLDIPISGAPDQTFSENQIKTVRRVGLVGSDYHGMKPTMKVKPGDQVKSGTVLFCDKKNPGIKYTAPAGGKVLAIHRGAKRVFQSIVIEIAENEEQQDFGALTADQALDLSPEALKTYLADTGLWTAFRTRPYSKVPDPDSLADAIFVTAMDTNPLALHISPILQQYKTSFNLGIRLLTRLTTGKVFVCHHANETIPIVDIHNNPEDKITYHGFSGKHPAGLPGTHIHMLYPVSRNRTVWYLDAQDVIAIAETILSGRLFVKRYISLSGPLVKQPRMVATRIGASVTDLIAEEIRDQKPTEEKKVRVISGSILHGHDAQDAHSAWLGRYHHQISLLELGDTREFMGWLSLGMHKFSALNIYLSRWLHKKTFDLTSTTNGSERAMLPIGIYEKVMPLDILPTQLLRAIIVGDIETAEKLGMLELDEEDLALCTFVCPGKYAFGPILRDNLTRFEKEI